MNKIILQPGDLNDTNRDYLPEAIKGSRMVVNENGNNSQVYPNNLKEFSEDILHEGIRDVWYEYVPSSYDPHKKTPVVFSMHGGLMTGWGQCIYTSWSLVAEKEGFICVFPNASSLKMWMIECVEDADPSIFTMPDGAPALNRPTGKVEDFHDVRLVLAILEKLKTKYHVDESRVYIQGMSMGNAMTSGVARHAGQYFAGAAGSGCPTHPRLLFTDSNEIINKGGPMDIWQSRLEHDNTPYHYGEKDKPVVLGNINYWRRLNDAMVLPKIEIHGEKNLVFYGGKTGNVVLMDVYNRDHGQTFDDAQMVWDYLFSGVSKEKDGTLIHTQGNKTITGDRFAIAACEGADRVWIGNQVKTISVPAFFRDKLKYHGLDGGQIVRGSYLYVPLSFLADAFGGEYTENEEGTYGEMKLSDGRILTFAHGCIGCTVDNTVESMLCETVTRNGHLCGSLEWFCEALYNFHVSCYDGVVYATDHYAKLSRYLSWILQDILLDVEKEQRGYGEPVGR